MKFAALFPLASRDYAKKAWPLLFLIFISIMAFPLFTLSAESAQVTVVYVPINLAFPLLPTQTFIFDNPSAKTDTVAIIITGSEGVVGIARVSAGD